METPFIKLRKVNEITKELVKKTFFKERENVIDLHLNYVNPTYRFGHTLVSAAIYKNEINSITEYKKQCGSFGINCYELGVIKLFKLKRYLNL